MLAVLLPLLAGAGLFSTNVVEVLGHTRHVSADVLTRPRAVPAKGAVRTEHLHERVPILLPVPDTADLMGRATVRVTEPLPQRFYQPGSHISPHIKRKLSKLRSVARRQTPEPIAMAHRAVQPQPLHVIEAVFAPSHAKVESLDDPLDQFWALERLYVEAAPPAPVSLGSTPLPEPGTGVLTCLGLVALAIRRRARRTRTVLAA